MAKKQFKSESKRILDLMINSIYTHKEIFLRELISNASDAVDKLYFKSLTDDKVGLKREDFVITLAADKAARTLTVSDNGIGMTQEELERNLGTIAHSGSGEFQAQNETSDDVDIIGRFGVGFYSAFMVADKIEVTTRAYGSDAAYKWTSQGADGYTIAETQKETVGTDIVLTLKENTGDENYDEFLDGWRLQALVKRYSDYIRYPIRMDMEKQRKKEGSEDEYESYTENETLNSMVPLWRRDKKSITKEEYESFYREKFGAWDAPLAVIHQHGEGTTEYRALLYIPEKADYNFYTKEFEPGLQLYSRGVLIMDRCADVLPDCFNFVKGLVDSEDLTLNISRETLQHDRQVAVIKKALEKRIKKELADLQKERREDYDKFFAAFGLQLKYALYRSFGTEREQLGELLEFRSAKENRLMTFAEYRAAMPEAQKYIYYAAADKENRPVNRAAAETVLSHSYDILYLEDDVDEFLLSMLHEDDKKEFRSISNGDLGLLTEEETAENAQKSEQYKDLFAHMKEHLGDKVSEVRLSQRLGSHPVCLASEGAISIEMEKTLGAMPGAGDVKAKKVLELGAGHPVFAALTARWPDDAATVDRYTDLLYNQALLLEGLPLDDPMAFSAAVCELMK